MVIYCPVEPGVFVGADGAQAVRVICLQVVVVERVDAGQQVLHLAVEFLRELHPWQVRWVAPQADVESPVG